MDLSYAIDSCRRDLENAHRDLQSLCEQRQVSSVSDIYRDILALDDEFEDVQIDLKEHALAVTTDRIVLEDMPFGRFEIWLDWQRLGEAQPYRVVALDPNPAARNDDVTHPHVQDEQLCEGEGRSAVQAALAECRLHDFFLLVSQLLHTYGIGSAYVELDNWYGIPCEDCGDLIDEDDRYNCDRCDRTLCGHCSISCQDCGPGFCSDCIPTCGGCGREFCSSCLDACPRCHKMMCNDCLERGPCRDCYKEQCDEETDDDKDPTPNDAIEQPAACL